MRRFTRITVLLFPLWVLGFLGISPVAAQPTTQTHGDWEVICQPSNGSTTHCQMMQALNISSEEGVTRAMEIAIVPDGDGNHFLEMMLFVFGLDLRPGVVMQVDEGAEFHAEFMTCVQQGCVAVRPLTDEQMAAMRAGRILRIGFRPIQSEQIFVMESSLMGFTAASRALR